MNIETIKRPNEELSKIKEGKIQFDVGKYLYFSYREKKIFTLHKRRGVNNYCSLPLNLTTRVDKDKVAPFAKVLYEDLIVKRFPNITFKEVIS